MADDALQIFTFLDFWLDDNSEIITTHHTLSTTIFFIYSKLKNQNYVPKIQGYVENIIPQFLEEDFVTHYRVGKEVFGEILLRMTPDLLRGYGGGIEQTTPQKQLLVFLCYLANQESMREVGHYFGLSQSTVHGILRRVSVTLNNVLGHIISWPDHREQHDISVEFQLQSQLAGIVGALDGTHIRLSGALNGDQDYINRKGFPSVQLQIVCDHRMLIRHSFTGWPGSTHDARVLRQSSLLDMGENSNKFGQNKYLIADSAYPLYEWLITPFKDNGRLNQNQRRFNRLLSRSRQVVERCIGLLKGRFQCLRELTLHILEDIIQNIASCCILHNLCVLRNDNIERFMEVPDDDPNQYPNIFNPAQTGMDKRQQLVNSLP